MQKGCTTLGARVGLTLLWAPLAGCSTDLLLNRSASFGGDTAGDRGEIDVIFINNTSARAIFTVGTYDDLNQFTVPDSRQFGANPDGTRLEADDNTTALSFDCARVLSIGGDDLLHFVEENDSDFADSGDRAALVPGIYFSSSDLDSLNAALPTAGVSAPFNAYLGVDFPCEALVVVRFEVNDAGPEEFRVEMDVFPP